ncbi:MAG: hypothetical protein P4M11_14975 [Candidatus Pacebacteria bacterium]|nr:hypothetical protein [Candidatus Paceibacterota bacterium]
MPLILYAEKYIEFVNKNKALVNLDIIFFCNYGELRVAINITHTPERIRWPGNLALPARSSLFRVFPSAEERTNAVCVPPVEDGHRTYHITAGSHIRIIVPIHSCIIIAEFKDGEKFADPEDAQEVLADPDPRNAIYIIMARQY